MTLLPAVGDAGAALRPFARAVAGSAATLGAWLPPCCSLCGAAGERLDLCAACRAALPSLVDGPDGRGVCVGCGEPAPQGATSCGRCDEARSPFADIVAPFLYAPPLDSLVQALKHGGDRRLGRLFGELLAEVALARTAAGRAALPDCLLAVPVHAARRAERGFNQAEDIAAWTARRVGVPLLDGASRRVIDTGSLAARSRAERALAIRGAFRVSDAVAERRVALVDDVLTSGATAGELARECYDTGALSVTLWVVARTPAPSAGSD